MRFRKRLKPPRWRHGLEFGAAQLFVATLKRLS